MNRWLNVLRTIAYAAVPLVPGGSLIVAGIGMAEQLGKDNSLTGAQKRTLAVKLAASAAAAINEIKGHVVINVDAVIAAADKTIDSVIAITNVAHKND